MIATDSLRQMVREVLAEEIARARRDGLVPRNGTSAPPRPKVREEHVTIRSDADLAAFVQRLAKILADGRSREEIEQGRWVFRLGEGGSVRLPAAQVSLPSPAAPVVTAARIERGIVSERQIEALPSGTSRLQVGRAVRFTPLARDRLRARGIEIERTS